MCAEKSHNHILCLTEYAPDERTTCVHVHRRRHHQTTKDIDAEMPYIHISHTVYVQIINMHDISNTPVGYRVALPNQWVRDFYIMEPFQ